MIAPARRKLFKHVAIVIGLCLIAEMAYLLMAAGPIFQDRKQVAFLAAQDPGSFLIPTTCLFFRGTEGKDFVRGPERRNRELCWYTRAGFKAAYPELWLPVENLAVQRQVWRMGVDIYRAEQGGAPLRKAVEISIRIGAIGLMSLVCVLLLAWQGRRHGGKVAGDWRWRRRDG